MDPVQLEGRLASIEKRLSSIESRFTIIPPSMPAKPAARTAVSPIDDPWDMPPRKPSVESVDLKPGNWLGVIAVICFVLAAAFIIKLSIDSGWLTPARQVGLAALFGMSLVGAGLALLRSDREYASFLPGAGVIILFITAFAAHRYYALISFEAALGLTTLISGLCIGLYIKIKYDIYPITATVGAYIAPVVLGFNVDGAFSLYYFLICSVAFATISAWVESRVLLLISAYLAITMSSLVGMDLRQDELIAVVLALHFFIFTVGAYHYARHTFKIMSEAEAMCFLPVLLIFYATEYYFINRIHHGLAPWISLGFAGFLIGLYLIAKQRFPDSKGSRSVMMAYVAVVCFHSVYLELLPDEARPWLFPAIMVMGAFALTHAPKQKYSEALIFPAMALFAMAAIEYLAMASHLLQDSHGAWLPVSFASLAGLWLVIARADDCVMKHDVVGHTLLGTAHVLAILALHRLTSDIGSLAVSASWLLYAVSVVVFAFLRKDECMLRSALLVLGFAAGKALLYDAASAPTIVRILCLLLTGVVLYGCGFFMRKTAEWKKTPNLSKK